MLSERERKEITRLIRSALERPQSWTLHEARRMEWLERRATRDELKRAWKEAK